MKPKIFIGFTEVAGYFNNLKMGFNEIGIECVFFDIYKNHYNYNTDKNNFFKLIRFFAKKGKSKNLFLKLLRHIIFYFLFFILFIWILFNFNVIIYTVNNSFLSMQLFLFKLFKKKIIFVSLGSDFRPFYLNGVEIKSNNKNLYLDIYKKSIKQKRKIKYIEKYSTHIINYPPQAHFQEKNFISGLIIGFPMKQNINLKNNFNKSKKIRILHSPSRPIIKGTKYIEKVISKLIKKGYNIDFVKIENSPNQIVISEIKKCDFVIDQMFSDTPLAGFATEAGYLGKPAVVGGYYSNYLKKDVFKENIPPSYFVSPNKFEFAIEKMIQDTNFRLNKGKVIQKFVLNNWDYKIVAKKYLKLITNNFPKDWFYNPYNIKYVEGCGISKNELILFLSEYISKYGVVALNLRDKPNLEKFFLNFIKYNKKEK